LDVALLLIERVPKEEEEEGRGSSSFYIGVPGVVRQPGD
jgi:hypothetical protein